MTADTFTTSLRFQLQGTGNNSGTWGAIADTQYQLLEAAITGDNGYAGGAGGLSIAGLTTYTLTVANGSADQARQLLYPFVGALTANCTVTLPGVVKIGWAMNATTGGHNVILTTGSGAALTLASSTGWTFFYCDGTNVSAIKIDLSQSNLAVASLVSAGTAAASAFIGGLAYADPAGTNQATATVLPLASTVIIGSTSGTHGGYSINSGFASGQIQTLINYSSSTTTLYPAGSSVINFASYSFLIPAATSLNSPVKLIITADGGNRFVA